MSSDNFLDKNALSLSALRELCVAYDKVNNTHRPPGHDVFSFIARHVLKNVVSIKDIVEVTDIKQWAKDVDNITLPPVFNHGTVRVTVTPVNDDTIDVEAEHCEESVMCSDGQLQMLKEGADPNDESAWMSVCAMSDLTVAFDPASDQSITGSVGIPAEHESLTEWTIVDSYMPEDESADIEGEPE